MTDAARRALGLRYRLLPYFYSAFEEANRTGAPVARPLWWHCPADPRAHAAGGQRLLGEAVLVSPVMEEAANQVCNMSAGLTVKSNIQT